jgi:hypothetical protein
VAGREERWGKAPSFPHIGARRFFLFESFVDPADPLLGRGEGFVARFLPFGRAGLVSMSGRVSVRIILRLNSI